MVKGSIDRSDRSVQPEKQRLQIYLIGHHEFIQDTIN